MLKILITGGAGFIASSLAERLIQDEQNYVVLVDNLLTGSKDRLPAGKNSHFIKADVNRFDDLSSIMVSYQFDYVFHYAAVVGVQRTLNNPVMVLNDIKGIRNVLDLAKNTGVKCVYYASSSEVYGEMIEMPQNEETTPLNSRLPYAVVKNVGESFLKSFHKEYGLNYNIFRFFNTYGPRQSSDFVVSRFIRMALNNQDITVHGEGRQTRTFLFIDDNIETTVTAFKQKRFQNEVINVGHDKETSVLDLAKTIISLTQSKSKIVHGPALKEGDMQRRMPDNSKMKALLGRELIPLEEGLKKTIASGNF
jgi:UDP-glucuronate decarboxylase